jgi:hypothetical protein
MKDVPNLLQVLPTIRITQGYIQVCDPPWLHGKIPVSREVEILFHGSDTYENELRPRLHETGTKSNRDHLVSVIVLFIIDVYMRLE